MDSIDTSFIQEKYIYELAPRLEKFNNFKNCFNFRCPLCGDSKSNSNKKRGYLFRNKDGDWMYKCFNCGEVLNFWGFLKRVDEALFLSYRKEISIGAMRSEADDAVPNIGMFKQSRKQRDVLKRVSDKLSIPSECVGFMKRLDLLPDTHRAVAYLDTRHVPFDNRHKVYWTENFRNIVDKLMPNKYDVRTLPNEGIVFPIFGMGGGDFHGFQIRCIDPHASKSKRFKTCVKGDLEYGCFGYENKEPDYVVEGAIDSLFLPNCIAVLSSSLYRVRSFFPNATYINDNEPRNKQIVSIVKKCVDMGLTTVMLPDIVDSVNIIGYDLNDLCKEFNWDIHALKLFIDEHAYKGLRARFMAANWSTQSC